MPARKEKIVSIKCLGEFDDYVYDLEVEDAHTFMANDIFVHNTDSVYFKDNKKKSKGEIVQAIKDITYEIKSFTPFPQDTFGFALEEEIDYLEFFPNEETGTFGKKNYLYVTKNDKLVIKGLPIMKRNGLEVSKRVLKKLWPEIVKNRNCRFPVERIQTEIIEFLKEDMTLCSKAFAVKDASFYKKAGQIEAQISTMYGKGVHHLIPNTKIGAGKSKRFCTFEEAKKLTLNDLDLSLVYSNLEPFTIGEVKVLQKGVFSWGG